MSRRKIFLCVVGVSVVINAGIFAAMNLCGHKAEITKYSLYAVLIALTYYIGGIITYFKRHSGDGMFAKIAGLNERKIPWQEMEYTETPAEDARYETYMRLFTWQFCVYWFAAPFFINIILFASSKWVLLWIFPLIFVPDAILVRVGLRAQEKKMDKEDQKIAKELEEQKRREEMGHFK